MHSESFSHQLISSNVIIMPQVLAGCGLTSLDAAEVLPLVLLVCQRGCKWSTNLLHKGSNLCLFLFLRRLFLIDILDVPCCLNSSLIKWQGGKTGVIKKDSNLEQQYLGRTRNTLNWYFWGTLKDTTTPHQNNSHCPLSNDSVQTHHLQLWLFSKWAGLSDVVGGHYEFCIAWRWEGCWGRFNQVGVCFQ